MIIAVSGKIGSGKTTAADYLHEKYSFRVLKTSRLLSSVLFSKKLEQNRRNLQDLGDKLIGVIGPGGFVAVMLEYLPEANYVLDAIRYVEAIHYLRERFEGRFYHVHIATEDKHRYSRMRERDKSQYTDKDYIKADKAPTESGNPQLKAASDFLIANDSSYDDFYSQLRKCYSSIVLQEK